jgi:hypothetical protein
MQKAAEMRAHVTSEIQDLERRLAEARVKLATLNELLGVDGDDAGTGGRQRNTKKIVLTMVTDAGAAGVTATEILEQALAKGRQLNANTVSSLLSKLKGDGALAFDGERYYAKGKEPTEDPPSHLRAVK